MDAELRRARAWYILDQIGHKIAVLAFGRVRYAICMKSMPLVGPRRG